MFKRKMKLKKLNLLGPALKYASVVALYQPVNSALAQYGSSTEQNGLGAFAIQYTDELIVAACIFLLIISSVVGVFYKAPVYGGAPLPLALKGPVCVAGGFCAFLYCLHVDKSLTLLTPMWVGAMSFVAPAIIHLLHAILIKHFGVRFGISEETLAPFEAEQSANR